MVALVSLIYLRSHWLEVADPHSSLQSQQTACIEVGLVGVITEVFDSLRSQIS